MKASERASNHHSKIAVLISGEIFESNSSQGCVEGGGGGDGQKICRLSVSLVTCRAEDMKQVLPRLARPQAGLKGKDDRGGMPERTVKGG